MIARWLKWTAVLAAGVLVLAAGVLGLAWLDYRSAANTRYALSDPPLPTPAADALGRGAHLYQTRGCVDCHGRDGGGREVMDAGPVGRMVASNITPTVLAGRGYDAAAIAAAIRHGVRADGTPLLFMPSADWRDLDDADTAALVAYLQALAPVEVDPGRSELRPLGWLLHLAGKLQPFAAAELDHTPRARQAPQALPDPEYGAYLAQVCTGCHGPGLAGGIQHAPQLPPSTDLTQTGLGDWSEQDFFRAMREGRRPDGSAIDPFMPWASMRSMNDLELRALWAYLRTLPGG